MNKQIILFLLIGLFTISAFSQNDKYSAPVKWDKYTVSDKNVSILLPKLPILTKYGDLCLQAEINNYAVYAEDVIYGFNIFSKTENKIPDFCSNQENFGEKSLEERIKELKDKIKSDKDKIVFINKKEVIFLKGELFSYWIFNDLENDKWVELWIANSDENNPNVRKFINSLNLNDKIKGIEIDDGADRVLGDFYPGKNETLNSKNDGKNTADNQNLIPVKFITRTSPIYTDEARSKGIQGSVTLNVTFMANGGIGDIEVISEELPFGLTEQAIKAAKKIIFLPARKNGVPFSETKRVQYTFTIY